MNHLFAAFGIFDESDFDFGQDQLKV